ncbi:MAG: hypothetical protein J7M26_08150 [Armatimonadetes bacterium]|nr:hypothetical protein [Armatimonadota bacterium]
MPQRPQVILPRTPILRGVPELQTVMVFRTRPDKEWTDRGMALAMRAFGVRGDLRNSSLQKGLSTAKRGDSYAEAYEVSGGTFCADLSRLWPVLSPDQIRRVKTRALQRNVVLEVANQFVRELGALPKEPTRAIYLPDEIYFQRGEGEVQRHVIAAAVEYRRSAEGIQVGGPGGKLKVYFDTQGEPAGLLRTMRVIEPYRKLRIHPASRVLAEIRKGPIRRQLLLGIRSVEIAQMKLIYYEGPPDQNQHFLQPAYRVTGVAHGRAGDRSFTVPYCEYVPALVDALEPMFPKGDVIKPKQRKAPRSSPQWGKDDE